MFSNAEFCEYLQSTLSVEVLDNADEAHEIYKIMRSSI